MISSLTELENIKTETIGTLGTADVGNDKIHVLVGMATCGIAAGARPVYEAFAEEIKKQGLGDKVVVTQTGCIGICQYEPIAEVYIPGRGRVTYVNMDADKVQKIISEHITAGNPVAEYTYSYDGENAPGSVAKLDETDFYKKQLRIALRNCGRINPDVIEEYIAFDGYKALGKVLTEMKSEELIQLVLDSGLRGRGGAGFPTGLKWKFAAASVADQKYVCCNADEGDPGAFMDRSVLEGDPHVVIEAMAIAGYAIGASKGYIYIRAEYPIAVQRLDLAIGQARKLGLLGDNIFGTGFSFDLEVKLGAGAFVCGEETALMTSIEGKRGEPRSRPPFPAVKGLFQKPTTLNNVETYANIPQIILNGPEWFSAVGTEKSKGTKVFALGGKITNTGLVEVPMGTTLRTVVEEIGGGIPGGKKFKAAQTGGPSGGCIPPEHFDVEIDYDNLLAIGSMMGSGGLIVMDEDNCMVDIAKFFLEFTVEESCGRCVPCRIGTKRLYEMLEKIISGNGELSDLDEMEKLCYHIKENSLCGLGQTAPNPVLSTLRYFRDEYIAHVVDKRCPSGVCKDLLQYTIVPEKCTGCTLCARNCPTNCIEGKVREPHVIHQDKCIKCGMCLTVCKFGAVAKV